MPLKLTSTQSEKVILIQEESMDVTFDEVKIVSHTVSSESNEIYIMYERFNNGIVVEERRKTFKLQGNDFLAVAGYVPDGVSPLYLELKTILYSQLINGLGLAGTVI